MPDPHGFPELPILASPPPQSPRTQREKYGALFYLGTVGLVVLVLLIAWFAVAAWSLRAVWGDVYVLHDRHRGDDDRIAAAYRLARDPRLAPQQRFEISLRKPLPPLARYLVAESLTDAVVRDDPRGFAQAVAHSPGWPDWLRLLMVRPLAEASGNGVPVPDEPLEALARHEDPMIAVWATYARAVAPDGPASARAALRRAAGLPGPIQPLAQFLELARTAGPARRRILLGDATHWLRSHHPDAVRIWDGWEEQGGRLARRPAPELRAVPRGASGTGARPPRVELPPPSQE